MKTITKRQNDAIDDAIRAEDYEAAIRVEASRARLTNNGPISEEWAERIRVAAASANDARIVLTQAMRDGR